MLTIDQFIKKYHYESLDAQQRQALVTTKGPILLLAVPGSGKTTTLLARLGYLIFGKNVDPKKILVCTYTVAATNEMRQRFRDRFGDEAADELEFRTINGICAKIIRMYEKQGHQSFKLVDEGTRTQVLRKAWMKHVRGFPTEFELRSISTAITRIKNQMLSDKRSDHVEIHTSEGTISVGPIYREYKEIMLDNHWMDYDDQMVYARIILLQHKDILSRLQKMYTYFCIDEAQDTSKIQHEIIQILASKSRNLLMVGDEDQSIYGFRAAYPEALLNFETVWPDAKVLFMEQNYRSTPQIVSISDKFIKQNTERRNKNMHAIHKSGNKVTFISCKSRLEQYEILTKMIGEANTSKSQTAILYRNNDTILPIVDELNRKGIPYQSKGVDGLFFTHKITMDIKAFFRFALHPDDHDAFLQIYSKMSIYMKRGIAEMEVGGEGKNVFDEYLAMSDEIVPAALKDSLRQRKKEFENIAKKNNPIFALDCICNQMGYLEYLNWRESDTFRLDIIRLLAAKEDTIQGFLDRLEQLRGIIKNGGTDANASAILSTIHSSKGLEYDTVVLADIVSGVMPDDTSKCRDQKRRMEQMEEDRRLFYVGMTRAKKELVIMDVIDCESVFVEDLKKFLKRKRSKKNAEAKTEDWKKIQVDDEVISTAFGKGIILSIKGQYADILFYKENSSRTIDIQYATKEKILEKA